jgi:transposase-like protein
MTSVMSLPAGRPVSEVTPKAKRRRFTAEEKSRILREAAGCTQRGELGALLRREGLYSSHLAKWREQAERGQIAGLTPKKRGPEPKVVDARDKQLAEQQRTIAKLARRIERAEAIIEVQKKLSQLLGIALPPIDEESE